MTAAQRAESVLTRLVRRLRHTQTYTERWEGSHIPTQDSPIWKERSLYAAQCEGTEFNSKPIHIAIKGRPITKKNSQRIVYAKGRPMVLPSKQYEEYRNAAGWQIPCKHIKIDKPINLKCVYYMPTRHRVDLVNLLEATCDILVDYGVLADDNSNIVAGHDGSCVRYDKDNPRVEVTITALEDNDEREN